MGTPCRWPASQHKYGEDHSSHIAQEYEAEVGLVLTGTWDKDAAVEQLRLFPPNQPQWAKDLNIDSATGELIG